MHDNKLLALAVHLKKFFKKIFSNEKSEQVKKKVPFYFVNLKNLKNTFKKAVVGFEQ